MSKFREGELVKTARRVRPRISGIIMEVIDPAEHLQMLWDSNEPHYLVKDTKTGEFLSVIERGLERV